MNGNYLILAALVFAINLLPAFAPPTWMILVLFKINSALNTVALVAIGVFSASLGRYLLSLAFSKLRNRISEKQSRNLQAAKQLFNESTSHHLINFAIFLLSPLPSAQLFEAAGLIGMRIAPLLLAFALGRSLSYSLYLTGASQLKAHGLSQIFLDSLKSPWGIALQLAMIAGLYLLTKIDWSRISAGRRFRGSS